MKTFILLILSISLTGCATSQHTKADRKPSGIEQALFPFYGQLPINHASLLERVNNLDHSEAGHLISKYTGIGFSRDKTTGEGSLWERRQRTNPDGSFVYIGPGRPVYDEVNKISLSQLTSPVISIQEIADAGKTRFLPSISFDVKSQTQEGYILTVRSPGFSTTNLNDYLDFVAAVQKFFCDPL